MTDLDVIECHLAAGTSLPIALAAVGGPPEPSGGLGYRPSDWPHSGHRGDDSRPDFDLGCRERYRRAQGRAYPSSKMIHRCPLGTIAALISGVLDSPASPDHNLNKVI